MISNPLLSNNSERLKEIKASSGYGEFITTFAKRLITEPTDISRTVNAMEAVMMSGRVTNWAKRSNIINQTGGIVTTLSDKELQQAYESESTVSGMSSELPDELGGLRVFSPSNNDKYLDKIVEEEQKQEENNLSGQDLMALQARQMIDNMPINSMSIYELTENELSGLSNDQFVMDA
jgi:hypothetical protein